MTTAPAPEKPRPTHIDPVTLAEIQRLEQARALALEQARAAQARADAADALRALAFTKFVAAHGLPLATTYDQAGALAYPPELPAEIKEALEAQRTAKAEP